jgi:hypothetical protein
MTVNLIREVSMNQKEVMIYQITRQMMISEDSYNINSINNKILIKQEMSNNNWSMLNMLNNHLLLNTSPNLEVDPITILYRNNRTNLIDKVLLQE